MKTRTLTAGTACAFKDRYGHVHTGTIREVTVSAGNWEITVEANDTSYLHALSPKQVYTDPVSIAKLLAGTTAAIPHMHPGTLVRVHWGKPGKSIAGMKDGDLGVVIADRRPKYRVNVARLGGFGGQYAQAQATSLTIVDPAELQELAS